LDAERRRAQLARPEDDGRGGEDAGEAIREGAGGDSGLTSKRAGISAEDWLKGVNAVCVGTPVERRCRGTT
jgi:hypothetical protein